MKKLLFVLVFALLTGCSSPDGAFRLEEWGEGWDLEIKHEGRRFSAKWVKGSHRSVEIKNLDTSHDAATIENTLFLEIDKDGKVTNGRLKRIAIPNFKMEAFSSARATWWAFIKGTCKLDDRGSGTIDVTFEGGPYVFKGEVFPSSELEFHSSE